MTIDEFDTAILPIGEQMDFGDALFVVFHSLEDYQSQTIQKGLGVEHVLAIIARLVMAFGISPEDLAAAFIPNGEDV